MNQFKKGDILLGRRNSHAIHPIIFIEQKNDDFFIGCMLTTSSHYSANILLEEKYFKKEDINGNKFKIKYKKSYFVNAKLLKRIEWKPFTKEGELTSEGVEFILANVELKTEKLWEQYLLEQQS